MRIYAPQNGAIKGKRARIEEVKWSDRKERGVGQDSDCGGGEDKKNMDQY